MFAFLIYFIGTQMNQYSLSGFDYATEVQSQYLWPKPDVFQGYGLINLATVLVLPGDSSQNFGLFVYDNLPLGSDECLRFEITCAEGALKVTIAWTDMAYPSGNSGSKSLVNDLDLLVYDIENSSDLETTNFGNNYYVGNGGSSQTLTDDVNVVEQVELSVSSRSTYRIYIRANTLAAALQKVSVVVTYPVGSSDVVGPTIDSWPTYYISNVRSVTGSQTNNKLKWGERCDTCATYSLPVNVNNLDTNPVSIGSFDAVGDLTLVTWNMDNFDSTTYSILAVIITAPNGLRAQLGGSADWYYADDNLYQRQWSPYYSGSCNRFLNGSDLRSIGNTSTIWSVSVVLGADISDQISTNNVFSGKLYFEVDDGIYRPSSDDSVSTSTIVIVLLVVIGAFGCLGIGYASQRYRDNSASRQRPQQQNSAQELPPTQQQNPLNAQLTDNNKPIVGTVVS